MPRPFFCHLAGGQRGEDDAAKGGFSHFIIGLAGLAMLSPVFLVITFVFHIIVLWGFIYSAFQELGQMLAKKF